MSEFNQVDVLSDERLSEILGKDFQYFGSKHILKHRSSLTENQAKFVALFMSFVHTAHDDEKTETDGSSEQKNKEIQAFKKLFEKASGSSDASLTFDCTRFILEKIGVDLFGYPKSLDELPNRKHLKIHCGDFIVMKTRENSHNYPLKVPVLITKKDDIGVSCKSYKTYKKFHEHNHADKSKKCTRFAKRSEIVYFAICLSKYLSKKRLSKILSLKEPKKATVWLAFKKNEELSSESEESDFSEGCEEFSD